MMIFKSIMCLLASNFLAMAWMLVLGILVWMVLMMININLHIFRGDEAADAFMIYFNGTVAPFWRPTYPYLFALLNALNFHYMWTTGFDSFKGEEWVEVVNKNTQ